MVVLISLSRWCLLALIFVFRLPHSDDFLEVTCAFGFAAKLFAYEPYWFKENFELLMFQFNLLFLGPSMGCFDDFMRNFCGLLFRSSRVPML